MDPCSNAQSIVGARTEWRLERGENGLRMSWRDHGLAFVNNPYDDALAWSKKMISEAEQGVEIIGLHPSRTCTEWFHLLVPRADAVCFWEGRIPFGAGIADQVQVALFPSEPVELKEPENGAPFPSVLPYFGQRPQRFKRIFRDHGWCP